MYHYLFTNDLRISKLDSSLREAAKCFITNTVPSAKTNKSKNNNMKTLGFYFNLYIDSNCAKVAASGNTRAVVLNFIKKFQFPNLRTNDSFVQCNKDGITLAPMRIIVKLLYSLNLMYGSFTAYLTKDEIKNFVFYNDNVAKRKKTDMVELINDILIYRKKKEFPEYIDLEENNHSWKHEDRQIREMLAILQWSGCVREKDNKYFIDNDSLTPENKAAIFDIINYECLWEGTSFESYKEYMDMDIIDDLVNKTEMDRLTEKEITPEWFKEKAKDYPNLDSDAQKFRDKIISLYGIDELKKLSGKDLLTKIFLNEDNKTNLCYMLEFDKDSRYIFGSIKSGTAYKYGLHFSKKHNSWATGSSKYPIFLSEEEAVELGTKIRDYLIDGLNIIDDVDSIESISDYESLYEKLYDITEGYIDKVWFLKYYAIIYPRFFPPIYSKNAQKIVIDRLNLEWSDNSLVRMGRIREYVEKCMISNVLFSRIFWTYCSIDDFALEEIEEEEMEEKTIDCFDIVREPRKVCIHPINFIVYGAPGTGKTYSTAEYALAIIDNREVDLSKKTDEQRKLVMKQYNDYIKQGRIVFTTFHQSYGYEDFIQGLRPDTKSEKMSFKTVDGVFKRIADRALRDFDNNYVIIIDEINRANISKVFGELITLIEDDKRWGEVNETCATLQSGDIFAVPNNLYIIGTMNSADKSISLIDAALRRRFEFIEQKPQSSLISDEYMRKVFENLNSLLAEQLDSSDLLIGHSYFMGMNKEELPKVLNNSVIPLLYEYFYDNKKKVKGVLNSSVNSDDFIVEDDNMGRIFVERHKINDSK